MGKSIFDIINRRADQPAPSPPAQSVDLTGFSDVQVIQHWIDNATRPGSSTSSVLYQSYLAFCKRYDVTPRKLQTFGFLLSLTGIHSHHTRVGTAVSIEPKPVILPAHVPRRPPSENTDQPPGPTLAKLVNKHFGLK